MKVKLLSRVRPSVTQWTAAFQAPLSMGFSRQEYWSGVPLPSRVQLLMTPWTVAYQAPPSMGFSRQEYWSRLPFPSPGDLPYPKIEPGSPSLQADSLQSEPAGKPKNTGVGSLSLLQQIFLTQKSDQGLLLLQMDSLPAELPQYK